MNKIYQLQQSTLTFKIYLIFNFDKYPFQILDSEQYVFFSNSVE